MNKRLDYLDAIRGFSIIGILFMNVTLFSWPDLYDSFPSYYWSSTLEQITQYVTYVFVESNLYPVFAFLFGISMSFIFKSAIDRGLKPYLVFSRRLFFLLLIGAAHALLIWYGDILMFYAILGFLLLPFYRLRVKTIVISAFSIWVIPNILFAIYLFVTDSNYPNYADVRSIHHIINNYHGSWVEQFQQNLEDWLNQVDIMNIPFIFIGIFPMFLFGLAIAKSGYLLLIQERISNHQKLWIASGVMGLILKTLPIINPSNLLFFHFSEAFGGPLMGLFYVLTIIRFGPKMKGIQVELRYLGRMSMSNYLLQSILGYVVFKVFGLYGDSSHIQNILICLVIIAIQICISRLWLKTKQYGPIESIWRKVTYGVLKKKDVNVSL